MRAPDRVVVVGASGFGRECLDVLEAMQSAGAHIAVLGVVDDAPSEANLKRLAERGVAHLGGIDHWLATRAERARFVLGVGSPAVRRRLVERLERAGLSAFSAVHPSAIIGSRTDLGAGVVVCGGAVISTNVRLGRHVHVNPNATIGHDAVLDDYVSVNPAATVSGEVHVGERSLIGAGAVVLQGLRIGPDALVGAAACVTRPVPRGVTVKGVPARGGPSDS